MNLLKPISHTKPINLRGGFHALCILVFILLFFSQSTRKPTNQRRLLTFDPKQPTDCSGLNEHQGYETHCDFLQANPQCNSGGFFYYLNFFYCDCESHSLLGYIALVLWLAALFYLLGNTSADYFCSSLEKLSSLLKLPPTVAGVTLLPLGNGAPDVFASIAAFVGTDNSDVGLNSVSGGAVFIICVVVGTISICVADQSVGIDKNCFVRDVCTFLFAVLALAVILLAGKVTVGGAIAFVSVYVVYATFVAASEFLRNKNGSPPLLPANRPQNQHFVSENDDVPHLVESKVPHWMWGSNFAIFSEDHPKPSWGWIDEENQNESNPKSLVSCSKLLVWLEFPLMVPRRLTIPVMAEEKWSKGYAVASVTFAPMLLAFLWNSWEGQLAGGWLVYLGGAVVGCGLGLGALVCTRPDRPPEKCLLPWVAGGFIMSIVWFYMVANELVALLVALGAIFGVKPSVLGLTVLAWGNSMGDLMSNVALSMNGDDGVQIALSGCYAGPMFNVLVGLGLSMLAGAWSKRPEPYVMARDGGLFFNLGFIVVGLVWSLVMLPRNQMRPGRLLGVGLLGIYVVFLCLRISMAVGGGGSLGY